ncbi:MAG TPA: sigma-70 family RNA polymerase sigma factor [Acidimicrobiales bacterium]
MGSSDTDSVVGSVERPELLETVFDQHHGVIWAYLARRAGRERADELAGDVFVTAFARRRTFDPELGSVRAWLYGIASNLLRTRLRSEARAGKAFARAATEQVRVVTPIDETDDAFANQSRLAQVVAALAELGQVDREVLTLFAWERLSYEEIAIVLDVEVGTVRSRLSRARGRLRDSWPRPANSPTT